MSTLPPDGHVTQATSDRTGDAQSVDAREIPDQVESRPQALDTSAVDNPGDEPATEADLDERDQRKRQQRKAPGPARIPEPHEAPAVVPRQDQTIVDPPPEDPW